MTAAFVLAPIALHMSLRSPQKPSLGLSLIFSISAIGLAQLFSVSEYRPALIGPDNIPTRWWEAVIWSATPVLIFMGLELVFIGKPILGWKQYPNVQIEVVAFVIWVLVLFVVFETLSKWGESEPIAWLLSIGTIIAALIFWFLPMPWISRFLLIPLALFSTHPLDHFYAAAEQLIIFIAILPIALSIRKNMLPGETPYRYWCRRKGLEIPDAPNESETFVAP